MHALRDGQLSQNLARLGSDRVHKREDLVASSHPERVMEYWVEPEDFLQTTRQDARVDATATSSDAP